MTRISNLANKLMQQGKTDDIERELEKFDPTKLTAAEGAEWWHMYGITAFEDGREDVATERFRRGHEQFPESPMIRFALGQQYVRAKEPDKGFALFRKALFPSIPQQYALVEARYAYLHSRYDDARAFIRPFFDDYKRLKILDDDFLYMRGLPFFGSYWNHLAAFSALSGDWRELDEVTSYVTKNCSDYDFDRLRLERDAYHDDDPARLLPGLVKRIEEEAKVVGFPTGFSRMMAAVIEAREAPTLRALQDVVEGVALGGNDFPWLQDVKALTLAEAARRFGDAEAQKLYETTFLKRQALLFEPDIALEFWLLEAQERLKADLGWSPVQAGK